ASEYESLFAELMAARDSLEQAKRRLWDAKAAKERYELAVTRAIALRQAEVDAAKARYELELRTLDNLKATYDVLLKEIELAKLQAIAEAARQREEVIKAKEEDRLSIAEEQRRIAIWRWLLFLLYSSFSADTTYNKEHHLFLYQYKYWDIYLALICNFYKVLLSYQQVCRGPNICLYQIFLYKEILLAFHSPYFFDAFQTNIAARNMPPPKAM
ncbi:unnamed protein product, partial [marine sediment metagenome]